MEEEHILSDNEYRNIILKEFQLRDFDDKVVSEMIEKKYNSLKEHTRFDDSIKAIFLKKANEILSNDDSLGFLLFYSYDTIQDILSFISSLENDEDDQWNYKKSIFMNKYS